MSGVIRSLTNALLIRAHFNTNIMWILFIIINMWKRLVLIFIGFRNYNWKRMELYSKRVSALLTFMVCAKNFDISLFCSLSLSLSLSLYESIEFVLPLSIFISDKNIMTLTILSHVMCQIQESTSKIFYLFMQRNNTLWWILEVKLFY